MKMLAFAAPLTLAGLVAVQSADEPEAGDDRTRVERAVLDYVEGIYEVKPELIERSVHPELRKFGYWREEEGAYQGATMSFEQLRDLAARYNKEGRVPADAPKIVEVYDVLDQTACAKLTASWGVDYMQLAKVEGRWMILNVLWQTAPPERK